MTDTTHEAPDWENFAKAVLTDWPTGDLDGSVLFDLSLQYGMIKEVPGGYNSDHHIDAEGICPEEGDPWYEYTFRGEAGPGLYSITDMTRRIEELEAENKRLRLEAAHANDTADAAIERVRELEAKLAEQIEWVKRLADDLIAAEGREALLKAKLAKAVAAIEEMQTASDAMMLHIARTTLAELTGGKDE